jgi:hypothetical protein
VVRLMLLNNKRFHFRLMCFVRAHQNSIASTAIKQWLICVALNARTQAHSVLGYQQRMAIFAVRLCESPLQGEAAGAPVQGQPSVNRSKQGRSTHLSHHHSLDLLQNVFKDKRCVFISSTPPVGGGRGRGRYQALCASKGDTPAPPGCRERRASASCCSRSCRCLPSSMSWPCARVFSLAAALVQGACGPLFRASPSSTPSTPPSAPPVPATRSGEAMSASMRSVVLWNTWLQNGHSKAPPLAKNWVVCGGGSANSQGRSRAAWGGWSPGTEALDPRHSRGRRGAARETADVKAAFTVQITVKQRRD